MMEILKTWISNLCVAVVIMTIAQIILPNTSIKKHSKFAFSLIILAITLAPIINLLNFNKGTDENFFQESMTYELNSKKEIASFYDEKFILESIEENLINTLKDEFYENEFDVSLKGEIDFQSMNMNIKEVNVKVLENKKVKKVDKIEIGKEKRGKEKIKDDFLEKVESFVEKELKIPNENIYVSYS